MVKRVAKCFVVVFLVIISIFPVAAEEMKPRMITIFEDLSDQERVKTAAQRIFDEYPGEFIVVEVKDKRIVQTNTINAYLRGSWVENTGQYFIGDIFHGTSGTIKCYVNGSSVSSCSGTVSVYGDGVSFKSKTLYNTSNTNANMYWEVQVTSATLGYRVYLFD